MERVVVAIDPSVTNTEGSDETGIICAGKGTDGAVYVWNDSSGRMTTNEWGKKAVSLFYSEMADIIVAESNNGGDMVEDTIKTVDSAVNVRQVKATRGKVTRAEPVAALYEQGRVHHVGSLNTLEDQMVSFTSDFDRKAQGYSPDRVDALVWAITELFPGVVKEPDPEPQPIPRPKRGFRGR
jgi:predicted phage terminase large subunit-like protein